MTCKSRMNRAKRQGRFQQRPPHPVCRCPKRAKKINPYNRSLPPRRTKNRPLPVERDDRVPVPQKGSGAGRRNRAAHYVYRQSTTAYTDANQHEVKPGDYVDAANNFVEKKDVVSRGVKELNPDGTPRVDHLFPLDLGDFSDPANPVNPVLLFDGNLRPRGVVTGSPVQFNYGMKRDPPDYKFVYAWKVPYYHANPDYKTDEPPDSLNNQGKPQFITTSGSGWIEVDKIAEEFRPVIQGMKPVQAAPPGRGGYRSSAIKAAAPRAFTCPNGAMKINPCVWAGPGERPEDYLKRPGDATSPAGYVNLLYNLPGDTGDINSGGGITLDTFPVGTTFHRSTANDPPPAVVDLYCPNSYKVQRRRLTFVYGYVDTPAGRRYGWIADANLT